MKVRIEVEEIDPLRAMDLVDSFIEEYIHIETARHSEMDRRKGEKIAIAVYHFNGNTYYLLVKVGDIN